MSNNPIISNDPSGLIENNPGRSLYQLTESKAKATIQTSFGKLYQNATTGEWWSKDQSKHAAFKVHKQTSKGFEVIREANKYGDFIDKHKSNIGKFIPNSQTWGFNANPKFSGGGIGKALQGAAKGAAKTGLKGIPIVGVVVDLLTPNEAGAGSTTFPEIPSGAEYAFSLLRNNPHSIVRALAAKHLQRNFSGFYSAINIGSFGNLTGARGGFVIYPNKINNNMMKRVYSK